MSSTVDVKVENQLVRFTCPQPVDQDEVVEQLGGVKSGGVVIKILERPSATIVIDAVNLKSTSNLAHDVI